MTPDPATPCTADAYDRAISCLSRGKDLVLWSVIVSTLGELTQSPQDVITNRLLSDLTRRMGLKPEALRVALYRLRRDGWIDSVKTGRTVAHRLSPRGAAETERARQRIYARTGPESDGFTLAVFQRGGSGGEIAVSDPVSNRLAKPAAFKHAAAKPREGWVTLAPGVLMAAGEPPEGDRHDALLIRGTISEIPDWVRARLTSPTRARAFQDLEQRLSKIAAILADAPAPPALKRACLRILIVHHWRRLLLRGPNLPDRFFPVDWPGINCRVRVSDLLANIPRPGLQELNEAD